MDPSPLQAVDLPRYSPRLHRWFARYLARHFARHFTAVRIADDGQPPAIDDRPLIFYSNHPSWWDPALYMLLGHAYYRGRQGYGPMDAAALEKYRFFRRLGVFGVEQGTVAGARRFLRVASAVLERPGSTLWLTAGGEFTDPRCRPVRLKPGLAHLLRRLDRCAVVPLAIEYPFWDERLPEALVRCGEPRLIEDAAIVPAAVWQERLEQDLTFAMNRLAEDAESRDPARFVTLVSGRTGASAVYDLWRRARAALRGETFHPAHGGRGS